MPRRDLKSKSERQKKEGEEERLAGLRQEGVFFGLWERVDHVSDPLFPETFGEIT